MRKGNVYSLNKEEKVFVHPLSPFHILFSPSQRDLYNQSRSYGERVRYRNFALHHGGETDRSPRRSMPFPLENQLESSPSPAKDNVKSTSTKPIETESHRSGRTSKLTDPSSSSAASSEDEVTSDVESHRKEKKRIYESSVRTATVTETSDNDETTDRHSTRTKNRDSDDDLFTVREEKTLESFEGARGKKR